MLQTSSTLAISALVGAVSGFAIGMGVEWLADLAGMHLSRAMKFAFAILWIVTGIGAAVTVALGHLISSLVILAPALLAPCGLWLWRKYGPSTQGTVQRKASRVATVEVSAVDLIASSAHKVITREPGFLYDWELVFTACFVPTSTLDLLGRKCSAQIFRKPPPGDAASAVYATIPLLWFTQLDILDSDGATPIGDVIHMDHPRELVFRGGGTRQARWESPGQSVELRLIIRDAHDHVTMISLRLDAFGEFRYAYRVDDPAKHELKDKP